MSKKLNKPRAYYRDFTVITRRTFGKVMQLTRQTLGNRLYSTSDQCWSNFRPPKSEIISDQHRVVVVNLFETCFYSKYITPPPHTHTHGTYVTLFEKAQQPVVALDLAPSTLHPTHTDRQIQDINSIRLSFSNMQQQLFSLVVFELPDVEDLVTNHHCLFELSHNLCCVEQLLWARKPKFHRIHRNFKKWVDKSSLILS
jgi:hypothetical protein